MDGAPQSGTPSPAAGLGDAHRRAIAARLSQIEAQLSRSEWPQEANDALELLGLAIRSIRADLGIPSSPHTRHGTAAALAFMWLEVDELRSERLRAYGELTPAATAQLQVNVTRLATLVAELEERVRPSST